MRENLNWGDRERFYLRRFQTTISRVHTINSLQSFTIVYLRQKTLKQ